MKRLILILMLLCSPLYMSIKMNKDILFGFLNVLCLLGWCLSWAWFCRRSKVLSFVWTFLLALTILALLCSPQLWAACAASTSGAWTTGGNWTGCAGSGGVPASTDAVSVPTGKAMTCNGACVAKTLTTAGTGSVTVQSGGTLTVNNSTSGGSVVLAGTGTLEIQSGGTATLGGQVATNNTVEVTVGTGTTFKLDNGGTFNMYGSVAVSNTGTGIFNGHTICTPPSTSIYYTIYSTGVAASDTTLLQFSGTSYTTSPAVFEGPSGQTSGDTCRLSNNGGNNPKLVIQNAIFNNIGDAHAGTSDSITMNVVSTAESMLIDHLLLINSGKLDLSTNSGVSNATTFSLNAIDIRHPNVQSSVAALITSANSTTFTGTRNITNFTCDYESTSAQVQLQIQGNGFKFGSSVRGGDATDTTGLVVYNCEPISGGAATALNQSYSNNYLALDEATGLPILASDNNQNNSWADTLFYYHAPNAQGISSTVNRSAAANSFNYNFIDGDGYQTGDAGSFCEEFLSGACNYNIAVNENLNPVNASLSASTSYIAEHITSYNQAASYFGETIGGATQLTSFQYNLISYPVAVYNSGTCTAYNAGLSMAGGGISQTGSTFNNNAYWGMQNSGDPGASTCVVGTGTGGASGLLIYSSYLTLPIVIRGTQSNKSATSGTSGTTLVCSGCSFQQAGELAVIPGDYIYKTTTATWSTVASVTNGTTLVMSNTNAGISSGNAFDIRKSFMNISGSGPVYGSSASFGANDIHAAVYYMNPGAAICDYYNWIGGGLTCTHSGTSGDTNIVAVTHAMVAINGYDYGSSNSLSGTNCAANCPVVVTPTANLTPAQALTWLRTQYVQYNGMYKNLDKRGTPYLDMGATLTYPAAVIQ